MGENNYHKIDWVFEKKKKKRNFLSEVVRTFFKIPKNL